VLRNSTLHPILVIDGDLDHRRTIMATLLDQGFAVMPARVARQGIDYLLSIEPRCFTGVEFCGRVSRCEPRIPTIFTSRRAGELETALLLELGADDVIVQP
jgi:DNA-binding response OmpR family regulator